MIEKFKDEIKGLIKIFTQIKKNRIIREQEITEIKKERKRNFNKRR